jgi:hypothetical protein
VRGGQACGDLLLALPLGCLSLQALMHQAPLLRKGRAQLRHLLLCVGEISKARVTVGG